MPCSKRSGKTRSPKRTEGRVRRNAASTSSVLPTAIEAHIVAFSAKVRKPTTEVLPRPDELLAEIAKADNFIPALEHWTFATTAPVDGRLQETARKLSLQRHKQDRFAVDVLGWEEIQALMAEHPDIITEFYPEHSDHIAEAIEALKDLPSIAAKLTRIMGSPYGQPRLGATNPLSEAKWEKNYLRK